jgi:hypothetical protein
MKAGVKVEDDPGQLFAQGKAAEKAAAAVKTNKQYVKAAKKLEKEAPELLEKVRSGEMNIPQAKQGNNQYADNTVVVNHNDGELRYES